MYFRLPIEAAASGYRYGCVGLRIWLHWVTQTAELADADGWTRLRRRLDSLIEPLE